DASRSAEAGAQGSGKGGTRSSSRLQQQKAQQDPAAMASTSETDNDEAHAAPSCHSPATPAFLCETAAVHDHSHYQSPYSSSSETFYVLMPVASSCQPHHHAHF